nr:aldo/keto reductase [Actinoplanes capillaceus]
MGFGSMRLTVRADRERAVRVLRRAVELGVDHIDTAAFYLSPGGILDGQPGPIRFATELIRDALTPYPEGLMIVTKVGPDPRADGGWGEAITAEQLRRQVEENLRRLGVEALDLVNLRITRDRERFAERFGALAEMRAEGLIRHLGLSNVALAQLDEAERIAPVTCVQNAFAADLRRHEDLLRECGAREIAFVPFFAIAGPKRENGVPASAAGSKRRDTGSASTGGTEREGGVTVGDAGPEWRIARERGVSGHQVRLAWTLHQGPHVLAIPGTGDVAHLEENIAAGGIRLTAEELAEIDQR